MQVVKHIFFKTGFVMNNRPSEICGGAHFG